MVTDILVISLILIGLGIVIYWVIEFCILFINELRSSKNKKKEKNYAAMNDLVKMSDIINIYNTYDSEEAREQVMKLPSINAVIIPENATNGDAIKALYPNADIDNRGKEVVYVVIGDEVLDFSESWWNAPYKKGE